MTTKREEINTTQVIIECDISEHPRMAFNPSGSESGVGSTEVGTLKEFDTRMSSDPTTANVYTEGGDWYPCAICGRIVWVEESEAIIGEPKICSAKCAWELGH